MIMKDYKADEGLQGNDKIEKAIAGLQKETTQEMLAHTLTVIRRRMKDAGQLIIGDGLRGTDEVEVPVVNGEYCKTARLPQPMPIFLSAPPNPVASWPLK